MERCIRRILQFPRDCRNTRRIAAPLDVSIKRERSRQRFRTARRERDRAAADAAADGQNRNASQMLQERCTPTAPIETLRRLDFLHPGWRTTEHRDSERRAVCAALRSMGIATIGDFVAVRYNEAMLGRLERGGAAGCSGTCGRSGCFCNGRPWDEKPRTRLVKWINLAARALEARARAAREAESRAHYMLGAAAAHPEDSDEEVGRGEVQFSVYADEGAPLLTVHE